MANLRIGDGTAPPDFPAYSRGKNKHQVQCNFRNCGHTFIKIMDGIMMAEGECKAEYCSCPCCQMIAGEKVHGLTYG